MPDTVIALIPPDLTGMRLDQVLARMFPDYSRARLQAWIRDGNVQVNGEIRRPRDKVAGGETVLMHPHMPPQDRWEAQDIQLNLVHEDADVIVLDKPAGLVVHPGAGNPDGTLVNALLHHDPALARLPRAGIIHRIDKDTSGLLVVAHSPRAHKSLVDQIKERQVSREYQAVVAGVMTAGGRVEAPIGRHPRQRTRMAVVPSGKPAVTNYRVVRRFRAHTWVSVSLETGRTHQIRVHMAHLRFPLLGDPVYGGRMKTPPSPSPELLDTLRGFKRQALHASRLEFTHPASGKAMAWQAPLPADLQHLLDTLEKDARHGMD